MGFSFKKRRGNELKLKKKKTVKQEEKIIKFV